MNYGQEKILFSSAQSVQMFDTQILVSKLIMQNEVLRCTKYQILGTLSGCQI